MRVIIETDNIKNVFLEILQQYDISYCGDRMYHEDVADELIEAIKKNEDD